MSGGPSQYLILPDPLLTRDRLVSTTDNGADFFAGPAVPDSSNEGDLMPYMEGVPVADESLDLRICQSGGMYTATWAWKGSTDASDQWRGQHDPAWPKYPHDPWQDDPDYAYGLAIVVSKAYNRIVAFRWGTGSTWAVRYRTIGDPDPTKWESTTFVAERAAVGAQAALVGWELPDGALRLVVKHQNTGVASDHDLDLYGSTDGGLTWTRIETDLLYRWTADGPRQLGVRVYGDVSGDWMRIACHIESSDRLVTLVSSDRGATWRECSVNIPYGDTIATTGDTYEPRGLVAMVGNDTDDGLFMLAMSVASGVVWMFSARRDEDWTHLVADNLRATNTNVIKISGCRTPDNLLFVLEWDQAVDAHGFLSYQLARDDPEGDLPNPSVIADIDAPNYDGTMAYMGANIVMAAAGAEVVMLAALVDRDTGGAAIASGAACLTWYGWSRRTVGQSSHADSARNWDGEGFWQSPWGTPDLSPGASYSFVGTAAVTWEPDSTRIVSSIPSPSGYYEHLSGSGITFGDGSAFAWVARVTAGGSLTATQAGLRLVGVSSLAGTTFDIAVRLTPTSLAVYDNIAGATVGATVTGLTLSLWTQYQLSLASSGGNLKVQLAWAGLGDYGWTEAFATPENLSLGPSGVATKTLRWGHVVAGAGTSSYWREMAIQATDDRGLNTFSNPDTVLGAVVSPRATTMENGVAIRWSGGGGFAGDSYVAALLYGHGVESAFTPSPAIHFRSQSSTTQQWVFDADATNGLDRWEHRGASFFGTNGRRVLVRWDNGGAPVALLTLSSVIASGAVIAAVEGNAFRIPAATAGLFVDGQLVDAMARVSTPGDPYYGEAVRITRSVGAWLHAGDETSALSGIGFAAGTTIDLYVDRCAGRLSSSTRARYLRLTLEGDAAGGGTPDDDHRIGSIVVGPVHEPDATTPIDWAHSDEEAGNVVVTQAVNGLRVAVEQGQPRRSLSMTVRGDIVRDREQMRAMLRDLAGYSARPLAVVLDSAAEAETVVLCRFTGATEHANEAWVQDSDSRWRPVGDVDLHFEEEV